SIGDYAFYECSELTNITIPDSITEIGNGAFRGCSSLTSITIPNGVTSIGEEAFRDCRSLKSITIPNSVTSIEYGAFAGCSSLTSITIPNSVTSIGKYAFDDCTGTLIISCNIPDGYWGYDHYYTFDGSKFTKVIIGNGVTKIGDYAFCDCKELSSITISDSITKIGSGAFKGCTKLKTLNINCNIYKNHWPDSKISDVTIGNDVTYIDQNFLNICSGKLTLNCKHLKNDIVTGSRHTEVIIGQSVETIADGTFTNLTNLRTFNGKYSSEDGRCLISGTTILAIAPAQLTEFKIPKNVTTVSARTFSGCSKLKSIIIPDGVTSIGKYAFKDCNSLTSITIPDSVTEIGEDAFENCDNLYSIMCLPVTPPTISRLGNWLYIYVPKEAVKAYKKDPHWRRYKKQIKKIK
ncbi:MAG: leucine-rich repeat domain-containing protein, partial [Alistipes sp.]|nr:leucine-rich repeat domain-containing protein [Alistipes sp.]